MLPELVKYKARFTNVYLLIQNGSALLVDTSSRGQSTNILNAITSNGLETGDLKYIFLTHTHYDHAGSVAELKAATGAKIIVHASEASFLEDGFTPIPKGTSPLFRIISKMGKMRPTIERKVGWYPPLKADIIFDEVLNLKDLGFDAKIIHTPGHTNGSSSLIVGNNAAVGDSVFNFRGNFYPGFADDELLLMKTWAKMLEWNVAWFYPAHGKRFNMDQFSREAIKKNNAKKKEVSSH